MDISTLKYMQDRVARGETLQSVIREMQNDVKLLESFPGIKIIATSGSPFVNSRPVFYSLKETVLREKLGPVIIAEINKIIAELEAEFAAL